MGWRPPSIWPARLAALLLVALPAAGQAGAAEPESGPTLRSLVRDTFRDRDGLPQNAVRALLHASSGQLWIATDEGLAHYDGATFTLVGRREDAGLTSDIITSLAETADGTLWAGTYDGGLVRRRAGSFEAVAIPGATAGMRVAALAPDGAGGIWVASDTGAFLLSGGEARRYAMPDGLPDDRVNAVALDRDGTAWLGTRKGLARVVGGRLLPGPPELRGVSIQALLADPAGGVWAGLVERGVAHLGAGGVQLVGAAQGLPAGTVTALALDRAGALWIGTQTAGLARLRGSTLERLTARDGLAGDWISTLLEDREGSMWVGTQDAGLVRFREADFRTLGATEGLSHDSVESLLQARNGDLWVATDGGVDLLPGGALPARRVLAGAPMSLLQARDGAIWIGTIGQGLWRWRDGAVTRLGQGMPASTWFRGLVEDAAGTLWAATTDGLYRVRGGRLEPVDEGLPVERPGAMALGLTARGELFVSVEGAGVYRRGGGRFVREEAGPPATWTVSGFLADPDGTLWLTTEGGGLWRRRAGAYTHLGVPQGLHADTLWALLDDHRGFLWMSSNRGIARVARADLDAVLDGRQARLSTRVWSMDDGLRSREAAGLSHPCAWQAADGRLWFATLRGASVVDPGRLRPAPPPPQTVIHHVEVGGLPVAEHGAVALAPGAGRLEIDFGAAALRAQGEASFRYRLVGVEPEWIVPRHTRAAQYTHLPAGDFRFEVQSRFGEGPWGPTTAIDVLQQAEAWRSPPALAALGLLALLGAGGLALLGQRLGRGQRRAAEAALRASQAEVAVLSALLPRCGWCHDPRRDAAYLAAVEACMGERPASQFDAGLCPACATRRGAEGQADPTAPPPRPP